MMNIMLMFCSLKIIKRKDGRNGKINKRLNKKTTSWLKNNCQVIYKQMLEWTILPKTLDDEKLKGHIKKAYIKNHQ